MQWYIDHVCSHVPHLDLVDIGRNMSKTVRLMGTPNPMKKFSNWLMLQPRNPYILGDVPRFCPSKNFFILILHTLRQPLNLSSHINFDFPTHTRDVQQPLKQKSLNLDLRENRKLQKFWKGAFW